MSMVLVMVLLLLLPLWVLRRLRPSWAPALLLGPVGGRSDADRARTAWRAMTVMALLCLALAWAVGEVVEEARTYAQVHGMPANDGAEGRADRQAVLALAALLLGGAALLRWSRRAREHVG